VAWTARSAGTRYFGETFVRQKAGGVSQQLDGGGGTRPRPIPEATVARLAAYERALATLALSKTATASDELAAAAGVSPATLRRDLSYLGTYGVRGVGYDVAVLTGEINRVLGASRLHKVALVGVGNLGAALANYPGFLSRGLSIAALFDVDPHRVGQPVGGVTVDSVDDIAAVCRRRQITIGVIATPERAAQQAANALVGAGVRAILAFTPGVIQVPADVELRKVDLAVELQVLAFHASRREGSAAADTDGRNNNRDDTESTGRTDDGVLPDDGAAQQPVRTPLDDLHHLTDLTDHAGATGATGVLGEPGQPATGPDPDTLPTPAGAAAAPDWPAAHARRAGVEALSRSTR
jgi:redox-sensing transcriptional repressor